MLRDSPEGYRRHRYGEPLHRLAVCLHRCRADLLGETPAREEPRFSSAPRSVANLKKLGASFLGARLFLRSPTRRALFACTSSVPALQKVVGDRTLKVGNNAQEPRSQIATGLRSTRPDQPPSTGSAGSGNERPIPPYRGPSVTSVSQDRT